MSNDLSICPKCSNRANTYRHPYAKVWCPKCGFVLREEGEGRPSSTIPPALTTPTPTIAECIEAIQAFADGQEWASPDWKKQPHIKRLFDIAERSKGGQR